MADTVEVRGFSFLWELFRRRGWPNPLQWPWPEPAPASALLAVLEIEPAQVEAVFVNGVVRRPDAVIHPRDRVALVPPGTPGPYRVLLGIWSGRAPHAGPREGTEQTDRGGR
ncbi:MAG: MoaD/ThiS family protein [Desulfotomaculales bacterium]